MSQASRRACGSRPLSTEERRQVLAVLHRTQRQCPVARTSVKALTLHHIVTMGEICTMVLGANATIKQFADRHCTLSLLLTSRANMSS